MRKRRLLAYALLTALTASLMAAGSALAVGLDGGYVGSAASSTADVGNKYCLYCHKSGGSASTDLTDFKKAGHPYEVRSTKGLTPITTGGNGTTTITDPLSTLLLDLTPLCSSGTSSINTQTLGDGCLSTPTSTDYFKDNGQGRLDWSTVQYVVGGYYAKAQWALKDIVSASCTTPTSTGCKTGYIVTGTTQYNLHAAASGDQFSAMEDWSDYGPDQDKAYDCAICHNTNGTARWNSWDDVGSGGSGTLGYRTQPWLNMGWDLASMGVTTTTLTNTAAWRSEWTLDGVQCEACHGKGSNSGSNGHADLGAGALQNVLSITTSTDGPAGLVTASIAATAGSYTPALAAGKIEICAMCHIRGANTSGGKEWGVASNNRTLRNGAEMQSDTYFIKNHAQYNELVGISTNPSLTHPNTGDGAHASLTCTSCHNPHKRAVKVTTAVADALGITDGAQTAQQRGVVKACEDCHGTTAPTKANGGADKKAGAIKWTMGVTCVDCHMAEATRSAPGAGMLGNWGKQADVKTHIVKISRTASDIVRNPTITGADAIVDAATVTIPVAVAKNALTVDYACGKCHDKSLGLSANGAKGLRAAGAHTRTQAQLAATNIHTVVTSTAGHPGYAMGSLNHMSGQGTTPNGCTACHDNADYTAAVDIATVCGLCHDEDGPGPYKTLTVLTALAEGMHQNNVAPVVSHTTPTTTNMTVTFNDTSTDANGTSGTSVKVNWGDGLISTGAMASSFTHTYTRSRTYKIYHSVTDGALSSSETFTVPVPKTYTITGAISGVGSTARVSVLLKLNGHTKKAVKRTGNGAFTFTKAPNGNYSIRVYSYHTAFGETAVSVTDADAAVGTITGTPQ